MIRFLSGGLSVCIFRVCFADETHDTCVIAVHCQPAWQMAMKQSTIVLHCITTCQWLKPCILLSIECPDCSLRTLVPLHCDVGTGTSAIKICWCYRYFRGDSTCVRGGGGIDIKRSVKECQTEINVTSTWHYWSLMSWYILYMYLMVP